MTRPEPLFRIHDSTPIYVRAPGADGWDVFSISRKTGNSIFLITSDGPLQLDRIGLERTGQTKRRGRTYFIDHSQLPPFEERVSA